jgi:RNA recognition motif-containing protein
MMVPPGGGVCQEVDLKCGPACMNGDKCTNSRVYVSGLPRGCTADDVSDMFGGIGVIARERPTGRGVFPDMMPYRVKFYGNDDCLVQYEDSHAAHAAPSFFDGQDLKGATLKVEIGAAKESEIPNFKGSDLGHFQLVSAGFWTSDHLSERSRSVDAFSGTRARGTLTLKRR